MSVDLSEFGELKKYEKCKVAYVIESLSPEDKEKVEAALSEPSIQTTAIHRFITSRGKRVVYSTVARHRDGECCCG